MNSYFEDWAIIQRLHDGSGEFRLVAPLVFHHGGVVYTVPTNFHTDLASIPRVLWSIFPPHGLYLSAAVLHDYFCERGWISRLGGDKLFYVAMKASNVPTWKALCIYSAVRSYAVVRKIR